MTDYKQLLLVYGLKESELSAETKDLIQSIDSCYKAIKITSANPKMTDEAKIQKVSENEGKIARFDKRIQSDILTFVNHLEPKDYKEYRRDPDGYKNAKKEKEEAEALRLKEESEKNKPPQKRKGFFDTDPY